MNNKMLFGEWALAISFQSWQAMRKGWWPWPPTLWLITLGFAILSLLGDFVDEKLANWLGLGLLAASFMRFYQQAKAGQDPTGGVPDANTPGPNQTIPVQWSPLFFGTKRPGLGASSGAATGGNSAGQGVSPAKPK